MAMTAPGKAAGQSALVLTQSKPLRLLTLLLLYFTQGFPIGLFFYVVPAWMGANSASTGAIASVVATASLPWSLKLVNGFLIDRYTFLPMGRRRAWIIGAQLVIVAVLVAGALLSPDARGTSTRARHSAQGWPSRLWAESMRRARARRARRSSTKTKKIVRNGDTVFSIRC